MTSMLFVFFKYFYLFVKMMKTQGMNNQMKYHVGDRDEKSLKLRLYRTDINKLFNLISIFDSQFSG